jgi:hypothetical protein
LIATLTIRNVDPVVEERLRLRAARNGCSVEDELRCIGGHCTVCSKSYAKGQPRRSRAARRPHASSGQYHTVLGIWISIKARRDGDAPSDGPALLSPGQPIGMRLARGLPRINNHNQGILALMVKPTHGFINCWNVFRYVTP